MEPPKGSKTRQYKKRPSWDKKTTRCCLRCDETFQAVEEFRMCFHCRELSVIDSIGSLSDA